MGRKRTTKNRRLPPRFHFKYGAYYHVFSVHGRRKWVRLSDDLEIALRMYYEREATQAPKAAADTFEALAEEWKRRRFADLKPRTRENYQRALDNLLPVFGSAPVSAIKPPHIGRYMDKRTSRHGANTEKAVMSAVFELAIRWGHCEENPARKIAYHPTKRRKRIITSSEWKRIQLAAPNDLIPCFMDLSYRTGLRVGDVLGLKWSNIEDGQLRIVQAKTDNLEEPVKAAYPITPELEAVLERAKRLHKWSASYVFPPRPNDPIICKRNAEHYTYYGFRAIWRRVVLKAKLDEIRIHDIRRTAVTEAERERGSAQEFSLHKTESEAQGYVVKDYQVVIPLSKTPGEL